MKAKEVQQGIINILFPFLSSHGFIKRKNGFSFNTGDFSLTVFYSWVTGDQEFPTSFSFRVGSFLVYRIQCIAFNVPVEKNVSSILVALTQSMVFKMKPKEFMINSEEDIAIMCDKVKSYLEIEGFRFFKEYQNYEKILNEMKSTPFGLFYGQGFVTWSLNALIISRMLGDQDYNRLVSKYIGYCEEHNLGDYLINKLKTLNTFLKNKNSEELLNY